MFAIFFCKFIKFAHTIQWGFLQKFLFGHFYVFRELFCLLQHILATVQPKIHLNTKSEILPFGWTKCPKTGPPRFFIGHPAWHAPSVCTRTKWKNHCTDVIINTFQQIHVDKYSRYVSAVIDFLTNLGNLKPTYTFNITARSQPRLHRTSQFLQSVSVPTSSGRKQSFFAHFSAMKALSDVKKKNKEKQPCASSTVATHQLHQLLLRWSIRGLPHRY